MENKYLLEPRKSSRWMSISINSVFVICSIWFIFGAISLYKQGNTKGRNNKNLSKPNIIFFMLDDLGYHDLGSYSQTNIKTPNLDRMAIEGIKFTNAYAGATLCAPSRSVLMTGQYVSHTTVRGNFAVAHGNELSPNKNRVPLRQRDMTIAEVLKRAGYTTGMVGKWGLGYHGNSGAPLKQGFDEYLAYLNQHKAHNHYAPYLWKNGRKLEIKKNKNGKQGQYTEELFQKFSLNFIRKNATGKNPFFLYMPYTLPHNDYTIPKINDAYENNSWSHNEKVYASMITMIDQYMGQIMDLLKNKRIDKKTIVFFCSDNGAAEYWDGTFNSSGVLTGHKRSLREGGIRTSMIVRWPGQVPADTVSDKPWSFADVLPTLAKLTGAKKPHNIDGKNILPTLLGNKGQQLSNRFFYWEFYGKVGSREFFQATRWKHWKGIRSSNPPLKLYDLSVDPRENYNVAKLHPDIVKKLQTYLDTTRTKSRYWPATDNKARVE